MPPRRDKKPLSPLLIMFNLLYAERGEQSSRGAVRLTPGSARCLLVSSLNYASEKPKPIATARSRASFKNQADWRKGNSPPDSCELSAVSMTSRISRRGASRRLLESPRLQVCSRGLCNVTNRVCTVTSCESGVTPDGIDYVFLFPFARTRETRERSSTDSAKLKNSESYARSKKRS